MNWVLQNFSKTDLQDFAPYTADEIHRDRATRLSDLAKTRRALLDQLVAMKVRAPSE
jgi:hypothetical protein